ncbi:hypothetical protein CRM22_001879, partial [Opisthorchis felineus]
FELLHRFVHPNLCASPHLVTKRILMPGSQRWLSEMGTDLSEMQASSVTVDDVLQLQDKHHKCSISLSYFLFIDLPPATSRPPPGPTVCQLPLYVPSNSSALIPWPAATGTVV